MMIYPLGSTTRWYQVLVLQISA